MTENKPEEEAAAKNGVSANPGMLPWIMEHKWWTALGAIGTMLALVVSVYACAKPTDAPERLEIENGNCNAQGGSGNTVICDNPGTQESP